MKHITVRYSVRNQVCLLPQQKRDLRNYITETINNEWVFLLVIKLKNGPFHGERDRFLNSPADGRWRLSLRFFLPRGLRRPGLLQPGRRRLRQRRPSRLQRPRRRLSVFLPSL